MHEPLTPFWLLLLMTINMPLLSPTVLITMTNPAAKHTKKETAIDVVTDCHNGNAAG